MNYEQRPYEPNPPRPGNALVYYGSPEALAAVRAGHEVATRRIRLDDGRAALQVTLLSNLPLRLYSPAGPRNVQVPRRPPVQLVEHRPHPSSPYYQQGPVRAPMLTGGQKWLLIAGAVLAVLLILVILLIQVLAAVGAALAVVGKILIGFLGLAALLMLGRALSGGGGGGNGINFIGNRIGKVNIRG